MRKLSHWLEELSPAESIDIYRELALSHAREGGTQGAEIARLIIADKLRALCEFEFSYSIEGQTTMQIYNARQALAFFQKIENLDIGIDREERAFGKFLEAEELCRQSNSLFKAVRSGGVSLSPRVSAVFHRAQRKISRILGRVPTLGELDLHFGPGATRATRRKEASTRRKLAERLQCSEELLGMVPYLLEELPHLVDIHSTETWVECSSTKDDELMRALDPDGPQGCEVTELAEVSEWDRVPVEIKPAKLSFVPKNAKTLRTICTEPGLNTLVQLGLGTHIARRLAAFGIDIRDQTLNQRRACEGSLTGALATLDLSSASDTISTELVYELLPLDWATLLNRARSRKVLLPTGQVISQEKFSSMGNGFTFPLETLIFWSLAASCCSKDSDASAYGDDLIVPTAVYPLLVEVLTAAGFLVNQTKSYHTGFFRESCGKDYYSGTDVRPIYMKGWVSGQSLFVLHNFYVRRGDAERAKRVESLIHPALRIYGPDGYGDGHLIGEHPRRRPDQYTRRGYAGYFFDTFVTRTSKDEVALERGEYVVALYSVYRRAAGDEYLPNVGLTPSTKESACFQALYKERGIGGSRTSPLPLPEGKEKVKNLPLPEVSGYKKISVYTLRA